jgi:hypothetical protein
VGAKGDGVGVECGGHKQARPNTVIAGLVCGRRAAERSVLLMYLVMTLSDCELSLKGLEYDVRMWSSRRRGFKDCGG